MNGDARERSSRLLGVRRWAAAVAAATTATAITATASWTFAGGAVSSKDFPDFLFFSGRDRWPQSLTFELRDAFSVIN